MRRRVYVGLDTETTGSDPPPAFQLVQLGLAVADPEPRELFRSDVGHLEYSSTPEAMAVNRFTDDRVRTGPPADAVDRLSARVLRDLRAAHDGARLVPVGWNVAGFDGPFVRHYLPLTAHLLSYQTVDLNAVCFTLAEATGRRFESFKDGAKRFARERIGRDESHDAAFDALASLWEWDYLRRCVLAARPASS